MNDGLKPNQEKRIIENCVESIMDDLDVYHFDEKLMNKYEKQLIEFFTKISEEHSLFSPGFDFSNKKNIVNDTEKLEEIKKIFEAYPYERISALVADEDGKWVKNRKLTPMLEEIKAIVYS